MERYDTVGAIERCRKFIEDFSTWYIRRSRERVGPSAENSEDKNNFYITTYTVLTTLCKLLAPITPFMAEAIYKNLTGEESVHLAEWPKQNQESGIRNQELIEEMKHVRKIVELGLSQR